MPQRNAKLRAVKTVDSDGQEEESKLKMSMSSEAEVNGAQTSSNFKQSSDSMLVMAQWMAMQNLFTMKYLQQ